MNIDIPIPEPGNVFLLVSDGTTWAHTTVQRAYLEGHIDRVRETLAMVDEKMWPFTPERAIILVKAIRTCSVCPDQWDAWDISGNYYYLFYRGGIGSINDSSSYDCDNAIVSFREEDQCGIELEELCRKLKVMWAPAMLVPGTIFQDPPPEVAPGISRAIRGV